MERLWRSVKYEEVYLKAYDTAVEAEAGIGAYLRFYNDERPHQALDYQTLRQVFKAGRYLVEAMNDKRLATLVQYRWQAVVWPGATCFVTGISTAHFSMANGQRGWKWQPDGGSIGDGTSPDRTISSLTKSG